MSRTMFRSPEELLSQAALLRLEGSEAMARAYERTARFRFAQREARIDRFNKIVLNLPEYYCPKCGTDLCGCVAARVDEMAAMQDGRHTLGGF